MGGSLQDQLLKSGLVTEDQLRDARERPRPSGQNRRGAGPGRQHKGKGKGKGKGRSNGRRPASAASRNDAAEQAARTKEAEESAERALRKRVHGMIADNTEAREEGETAYHFVKGSRVKRIYVTEDQRARLAEGALAVAAMKGKHYLIPMPVAREIRELIPEYFVAMGESHKPSESGAEVDDEYADFQVPDDLTW
jgi:uncharacterized protein YaiL (DUF2058 family)